MFACFNSPGEFQTVTACGSAEVSSVEGTETGAGLAFQSVRVMTQSTVPLMRNTTNNPIAYPFAHTESCPDKQRRPDGRTPGTHPSRARGKLSPVWAASSAAASKPGRVPDPTPARSKRPHAAIKEISTLRSVAGAKKAVATQHAVVTRWMLATELKLERSRGAPQRKPSH